MHITLIIWLLHPAFLLFTCSCTLIFASCTIRKISVSSGGEIIAAYSFDKLALMKDQLLKVYFYENGGMRNYVLNACARDVNLTVMSEILD